MKCKRSYACFLCRKTEHDERTIQEVVQKSIARCALLIFILRKVSEKRKITKGIPLMKKIFVKFVCKLRAAITSSRIKKTFILFYEHFVPEDTQT